MKSLDELMTPDGRHARDAGEHARSSTPSPDELQWVPVRTLGPRHRPAMARHLLALDAHDRYLRFGYPAQDPQIQRYVDGIDFHRDEAFGIFDRRLRLVALAHLAYLPRDTPDGDRAAEFGGSVSDRLRGRGIGTRLFGHAMLHARNRCVRRLLIHALTENTPMLRIARSAGATVERSGGDADAWLRLPPVDLASRIEEIVESGAAEIDYSLKQRAHQVGRVIDTLAQVRDQFTGGRRSAGN